MELSIQEIFLGREQPNQSNVEFNSTNTDVIVSLENGEKYVASFYAYANIRKLMTKHLESGDYLSGKYFWMPNMVLVDNCEKNNIVEVVKHLMNEGNFKLVFKNISKSEI